MRQRILSVIPLLLVLSTAVAADSDSPPGAQPEAPEGLAPGWYARIDTTMGRIVAQLLPEQAPQAVAQFVALAEGNVERVNPLTGEPEEGPFYDGTDIFRAKAGMQFEAGDLSGIRGGPSLWVSPKEGPGPVNFHLPGRLGLPTRPPRGASPYTFFITASAQPQLTGLVPCFGKVVEGLDVVLRITTVKTHGDGRPLDPVSIRKVRIFKVGKAPSLPELDSYRYKPVRLAPIQPKKKGSTGESGEGPPLKKNGDASGSVP